MEAVNVWESLEVAEVGAISTKQKIQSFQNPLDGPKPG